MTDDDSLSEELLPENNVQDRQSFAIVTDHRDYLFNAQMCCSVLTPITAVVCTHGPNVL